MEIEKNILEEMIEILNNDGVIHEYQFKELILNSSLGEVTNILEKESELSLIASSHKLYCPNSDGKQWINIIHNAKVFPITNDARDYIQKVLKETL
ncbi:hypothetical protein FDB81_13470 [Clostridium sporogenes]|uniref:hypothetical protein n=1 Tax=Clostridium TaxID=1485 RepID=UPI0007E1DD0A|nr:MULTISPECIES: hypothetical protein [Clostridium]KEI79113.1 hypothetical protein N452_11140 [Clostridium botulinum A2 117]KEI87559.1 hypothetical protein N492_11380 [Clostridium botulinum B2 267]MBN3417962.1 hypothetical protein [Clostridium botulinum]MBN3442649.1 hypothetical protein [Clostridium botulinum]MBY6806685.1 hypothetical protein [Clostridium botulinum]